MWKDRSAPEDSGQAGHRAGRHEGPKGPTTEETT
jgi:hypothetical protein